MNEEIFPAVWACAVVLMAGTVLQADKVSVGNGLVIDWRSVPCGEIPREGADVFEQAALFVSLVGPAAAQAAATQVRDVELPPPVLVHPIVHAYAPDHDGGRRRSFDVGPFCVIVEPNADDAAQAAFTARLASHCSQSIG